VSDDFLTRLREEPRPEFAARLEEHLHQIDVQREAPRAPGALRRLAPALAGAGLVCAIALGFTLEPVRAAARGFLDLFRVKSFAAVPVDPARLERLAKGGLDFKGLLAEQVQVVVAPEGPQPVDSPEAGALAAGITASQPSVLPRRYALAESAVARPGTFRVTIDNAKLQALALAAGADEIEIPPAWNGATLEVALPPVLALRYARTVEPGSEAPRGEAGFALLQSAVPQVDLPEAFDLATLGRLGLRVAGMSAAEALAFSRSIDWRSTLLVPVPIRGGTYREVDVSGHKGLLVTYQPQPRPATDGTTRPPRQQALLLWTASGKALAITGPGDGVQHLEMAESVR